MFDRIKSIKRTVSFTLAYVLLVSLLGVNVGAAEKPITVLLDGSKLVFEVEPEIMNGYTMVPIGQTIQFLTGTPASWDANTKTMTFQAYGSTVKHTVGENRIYIDGVARDYPISSLIVNSRTLVPIRMLADASKCTINWDGSTKTVMITRPYIQPSAPSVVQTSSDVNIVQVRDLSANPSVGSSCSATIVAGGSVTRAWLNTPRRGDFAETTQYQIDNQGRRLFLLNWTPQIGGSQTITAYVENDRGTKAFVNFELHVSGSSQAARIESLSTNPTHVQSGSSVDVSVVTNSMVDFVWYEFDGFTSSRNYNYSEYSNGKREFSLSFDVGNNTDDTKTLTVYAMDRNGSEDSRTSRITIEAVDASPRIYQINASDTEISIGDSINFDITVNSAITSVELTDSDGVRMSGEYYSSNGNNSSMFRIYNYQPQVAGTKNVTITGYSDKGNSSSKSISVHVNGNAETKINTIDCPNTVNAGETFTMNIYTVMGVAPSVRLSWDSSDTLHYSANEPDVGAGQMMIPVDIYIDNPGTYTIRVQLSGANGSDQRSLAITAN